MTKTRIAILISLAVLIIACFCVIAYAVGVNLDEITALFVVDLPERIKTMATKPIRIEVDGDYRTPDYWWYIDQLRKNKEC